MAVPTGAAKFSEIQTEFGGSNPVSLNEYYSGGSLTKANLGIFAPNGVPTSGAISVNDFRGAQNTSEVWATTVTIGTVNIVGTNFYGYSKSLIGSVSDETPDNGTSMKSGTLQSAQYSSTGSKGAPPSNNFSLSVVLNEANINTNTKSFKFTTDGVSTLQRADATYSVTAIPNSNSHLWSWASNAPGFTMSTATSGTRTQTFDCD